MSIHGYSLSIGQSRRRSPRRRRRGFLAAGLAGVAALAGVGLFGGLPFASAADNVAFDTGAGLTFVVDGNNGDITSLVHDGTELAAAGQAAGQYQSGFSAAAVSSQTFANGAILVTVANDAEGVTMFYFARPDDNTIYIATDITREQRIGEARFIARLDSGVLSTSPEAARTGNSDATVEGEDVFSFADGTTASKFYSSQRTIVQQPFGASGDGHGVFILPGTHELSSGGPFFRDIEVNDTGGAVNITHYMYSGHYQTEPLRLGLHGPYAMAVTDGEPPAGRDLDFLSEFIPGLIPDAGRGSVSGTAAGDFGGAPATVGLAGDNGQFFGQVRGGEFTIGNIRPGTYTATLFAGELAVGDTAQVTVTAGGTASVDLAGDVPAEGSILQLGTFDGTPAGFKNADKIETMHPSDGRMADWTGAVDSTATLPMAAFKAVNSPVAVAFGLDAVPADGVRVRIASTGSFAGGRPAVSVGGFTSAAADSPAPVNLDSRGVTRGTWRGVNNTNTFTVPASALQAGDNTLSISVLSGSSGDGFLSPNFIFDAIAIDPA